MRKLIILTDEKLNFLISIPDLKNYKSMDVKKIRKFFSNLNYDVSEFRFSALDLSRDYSGVFFIYQTSESPGAFYKRYIEDLVYFLELKGAIMLPCHELLKAHHNKIFMEMLRSGFRDGSLKSLQAKCYGSWMAARSYNLTFPVVVKQASSSGSAGVFLAKNKHEYDKIVKKAANVIVAQNLKGIIRYRLVMIIKNLIKLIYPAKAKYLEYNTVPVSTSVIVQQFVPGLKGDYKVLIFGSRYYTLLRMNRENDFRASGSGKFFDVPLEEHNDLLNFARKMTFEIDFPIFGIDIARENGRFHVIEFQSIHLGPPPLQRSKYWHEYHDGKWIKFDGPSDLEDVYSKTIHDFIVAKYPD